MSKITFSCTFLIFLIISASEPIVEDCEGDACQTNVPIPLMDSMNAPLFANLDISKLTEQLTTYIDGVVERRIDEAKRKSSATFSERVEKVIRNHTEAASYGEFGQICL